MYLRTACTVYTSKMVEAKGEREVEPKERTNKYFARYEAKEDVCQSSV